MKLKVVIFLDRAIEYSVYGVIFFIPISIALIGVFACVAAALFLIKQILSPDFSVIRSNRIFFVLLLIFFIFMSLSLINSGPLMAKSLKALFLKWGRFPLVLWMILDTFKDSGRIVRASGVFIFSSTVTGLSVLSQKFFGLEFLRHKALDGGIVTGPFANQNDLSAYLTCVIPVVLCFGLWPWKRVPVKTCFLLVTALLIMSSLMARCRGGWIGLVAGLILVVLLFNYGRTPRKIFWSLFAAGFIFGVPFTAISLFFLKSDPQRIVLYQGAWGMITEHPLLGKGLGTFMDYCVQYTHNSWASYAHNCFLQIWAESGIFSLLSFLLLNGYVIYKSVKVIFKLPVTLNSYILIGLNAGFLGLLVHCFFDTQLYSFQLSFLFWVILGMAIALRSNLEIPLHHTVQAGVREGRN